MFCLFLIDGKVFRAKLKLLLVRISTGVLVIKFSTQVALYLPAGDLVRYPDSTLSKSFIFIFVFLIGVDRQSAAAVRSI